MNFQEKWRKLLLPLRYGGSGVDFKKLDPARSPFLQDRDRIIYSSSFRYRGAEEMRMTVWRHPVG